MYLYFATQISGLTSLHLPQTGFTSPPLHPQTLLNTADEVSQFWHCPHSALPEISEIYY